MADATPMQKYVAEFVGTFLLVFTVGCNVLSGNAVWGGVSIGCMLMVAIYALAGISGANFNPAVSVTLGIVKSLGGKGLPWKDVGIYCLVQIIAGITAAFSYSLLFWKSFNLAPAKGFNFVNAASCEILYTFMLCFVVLNVAAAKKCAEEKNQWFGLAIGFVVVAGAYGAGAVSGGCFNPAVAIGIDTSSAGLGFGWCFVYMVAELIGALLAAVLFMVVRPEDFNDTGGQSELTKQLVSEFLGTFFLVLTVGLNVLGKSPAGAFSIAASLMCMIYALGDVSGAHFNPAVTVAILCSRELPDLTVMRAGCYVLVQLVGGILAAMSYTLIHNGHSFALAPQHSSSWGQVATAEIMFTFVLCFVVLCTAVAKQTKSEQMFGLAIGSCVTVGGFAVGGISGGSLNPAVSFGIAVSHMFEGSPSTCMKAALSYSSFEIVGGVVAALLLKVTHMGDAKKDVEMQD